MDAATHIEKHVKAWLIAEAKKAGVVVDDIYMEVHRYTGGQAVVDYSVLLPSDGMITPDTLNRLVKAHVVRYNSPIALMKMSIDGHYRINVQVKNATFGNIVFGNPPQETSEDIGALRRRAGIRG